MTARSARAATLSVLLAVLLGGVGALGAVALHRFVVQPSDSELLGVAQEVTAALPGLSPAGAPVVEGRWVPSLDRGRVFWEATAQDEVAGADVRADLERAGWSVVRVESLGPSDTVGATRDGLDVEVHVRVLDGTQQATVTLERGDTSPSLAVTVAAGAALGAALGLGLGLALGRRSRAAAVRPAAG